MFSLPTEIENGFGDLRKAARVVRGLATGEKNQLLLDLAKELAARSATLILENAKDLSEFDKKNADGKRDAFRDRLLLNSHRIEGMAESLLQVAQLPDPCRELVDSKVLANGLKLKRERSPLGILLMIFESRPNIVTEVFSLAFKSGNVVAMRGGSESKHSVKLIYEMIRNCLARHNLPEASFFPIENYDRAIVEALLVRKDLIDVVIPRGGDALIELVASRAKMPVIKNDRGMCHAYVDESADLAMAVQVVCNAKTSRPGVCNSLETVLVHERMANLFLTELYSACLPHQVEFRCDPQSLRLLQGKSHVNAAKPQDWGTEHLAQILNCRIVTSMNEAIEHIETYGSRHSETIITADVRRARKFQEEVDSAVVYWNASTRFTDGFEFGLGGELGISTQKLHVRGPVGLRELTTPRWIVDGDGQIR